jgi:hypothetical protein
MVVLKAMTSWPAYHFIYGSEIALSADMPIIFLTTIAYGANAKIISTLENYNSLGRLLILGYFLLTVKMTLIGVSIRNIGTQFTTYSRCEKNYH